METIPSPVARLDEFATPFRGKRVLITGGAGFIGSTLAIVLARAGARVVCVDNMLEAHGGNVFNLAPAQDKIQLNFCDIRDESSMAFLVSDVDFVLHCAGQVSHVLSLSDPYPDIEHNIRGTVVLMEQLRKRNPLATVVYLGTRGQYGSTTKLPVNELAATNPRGIYEISNLTAEKIIQVYCSNHRIPAVLLRLSNIYGPRGQMKHPHFGVVNWFVRQAIAGDVIKLFGDGRILRDFLYVDDCVEAVLRVALCEAARTGEVYNVGVDRPNCFRDVVDNLCAVLPGTRWEFAPFSPERAAQEPGDFYSDIAKLRSVVGWSPVTSLRDGLELTVEYYRTWRSRYF
jgi:UDP-glucose 4-epimerase